MASPFNVFRKNQKVMMALLVGFSMIAFIVADSINATNFPIFLGAVLGALALWLLSGRGGSEGWLIAAVGAVLGAVVGVYGPDLFRDNTAVYTAHGNLSHQQLDAIVQRQEQANRFLSLADMTVREKLPEEQQRQHPAPEYFGYANPADPSGRRETAVLTYLFGKEADDLGINVTDQAVNQFIIDVTGGKLNEADLRRIRNEMQVGTGDLIEVLREQLRAREAFQLLAPRVGPTPQELWADFRKLSTEAEVTAVAIPAEAFVAQVEDPSTDELVRFFQQYKGVPPAVDGTPGFLVPRQVQVAYLEIPLDSIKQSLEPPTDEEVRAFYDRNRAQFEIGREGADAQGETPSPTGDAATPNEAAAGDATAPVEAPRGVQPPNDESPTAEPPAEGSDEPATETKSPELPSAPEGEGDSAIRRAALEFVAFQEEAADAAVQADSKEAEPKPSATLPVQPPAFPAPPATATDAAKPAEPSAQTLQAIRQDLLNQRAREVADERIELVRDDLYEIVHTIMDAVPLPEDPRDEDQNRRYEQQRREAVREVVAELKAYAAKNEGLKFWTTPLLSGEELLESEDYPIGQAVQWEKNPPLFNRDTTPITQTLFLMSPDQPLAPITAQSMLNESRYVAIKIADVSPREPKLEDEGVRDRVVEAWKLREAQQLAKDRAEQLAAVAKGQKDLDEVATSETITGQPGGQELTARQVGPFSWLRRTTAPSTDFAPPEIVPTALPQLPGAGEQFMQTVFETLKEGQTGVAPAEDASAFYVVEVDRRGSEAELAKAREEFFREDFFRHPLDALFGFPMNPFRRRMVMEAREVQADWFQKFREKHEVLDRDVPPPQPPA